ncbi:chemotaxis response regulator protein-glutamate methylesterase [Malaciobacter molluscorum LMG 25693]|uniref:Protein-glutamate methylesterase/protein-glutamine glutaminase n=1 Tax=Malaciobacter molluscorum LMG 25693 TaxID=870501 RepID=A0A2G1DGP9_9BACT|nr:chemotaxis-specific protein-glutamate methyltransferase CheB [Malaciobacter molluscorum]AXX92451.1 MCP protein-glutamate methylesterase (signal receiver domain) [Malaciobacter molluscorum LMG 25693]PHO17678.1 chemotaxis response regulator protein-glutamate methylesterase [Malaciobacter molluscorum LMG 25693]RXJ93424.1 chemotaxis response regulator protein-glutamate methylesterase [Malaciobacter molluscorum]
MYTVLVIDDSPSMRRILKDMINSIEEFEVIADAMDAYDAREKIKQYEPDLVTIDINMPKMDGVTFLRNLMRLHPMPAVVVSGESVRGNDIFDDGAVGFIPKPENGESMINFQARIKDTLLNLTFLLKRYTLKKPKPLKPIKSKTVHEIEYKIHPDEVIKLHQATFPGSKVIAIGSSTGGVESLLKVFKRLPSNLPPIVITQHIPYGFSSSFAQRLNANSSVVVYEAKDAMILEYGHAYLAPGNMHLTIEKRRDGKYTTRLLDTKKVSHHKPSVDVLFRSVNNSAGGGAMAVMMTGMGDDGTIAMKELHDNGAYTVAQNKETCVVFGMPAKAIEANAVKDIVPLEEIADYIVDFSKNKRK